MGGIIDFVVSINKIALLAFFAVLGFLLFEVKKMIDDKRKKEKPTVPQFDDTLHAPAPSAQNSTPLPPLTPPQKSASGGNPVLMIMLGVVSLICVVGVIIYMGIKRKNIATAPVPIVREITSAGLKIYDSRWGEIDGKKNTNTKPGDKLFIGIQTIVEADIDRARIKINSRDWQISDITTLFNPELKVYYREYIVATGTAQLKIEAQLHSASDGWLGD